MGELVLTTFDWVPEPPRGYVRDLRVRWALEEAALPYRVASVPFEDRGAGHLAAQPFAQVPWLRDGDLQIFESGAILLHLGANSEALLPAEPRRRSTALQWVFGALNSVEMASLPWGLFKFMNVAEDEAGAQFMAHFLELRLQRLEPVLADTEWLAGGFSLADILLADVLRLVDRFGGLAAFPACRAYTARAVARPAFTRALADQLAHFSAADAVRAAASPD